MIERAVGFVRGATSDFPSVAKRVRKDDFSRFPAARAAVVVIPAPFRFILEINAVQIVGVRPDIIHYAPYKIKSFFNFPQLFFAHLRPAVFFARPQ